MLLRELVFGFIFIIIIIIIIILLITQQKHAQSKNKVHMQNPMKEFC